MLDRNKLKQPTCRQFIEKAIAKLRQKGVKIDQPVRVIDLRSDYAAPHWPGCFTQLKEKKIQFVLYFDSLNDKTSHGTRGGSA